jgi:Mg-chelatase subunit ChlD
MSKLMRCLYCGLLQDEPAGVKTCSRCGGELAYEAPPPPEGRGSYVQVQMELDQVSAPAGRTVDRYLLVTLCTPKSIPLEHRAAEKAGRPAMNFTPVLDVSGSMHGAKLAQAKEAVQHSLHCLQEGDTLSLVTFSDRIDTVLESTSISSRVRGQVQSALEEIYAGGMTALCAGLERGIQENLVKKVSSNLVLLLSDGQANVGETDVERVGQRALEARQQGLVVSTLGVGADYNEALMVEIATQGGGRYYHIEAASQIVSYLTGELGEAVNLAAREVHFKLNLPPGAILAPLSSLYSCSQNGSEADVTIGDLLLDQELEVPLRLTLLSPKEGLRLSVEGEVHYTSPAGKSLYTPINRVTVRVRPLEGYSLREGAVKPVVERVAHQMHANEVLAMSRAMARGDRAEMEQVRSNLESVRGYISLLDEEKAHEIRDKLLHDMDVVESRDPLMSKRSVSNAFRTQRSQRDFDK